MAYFQTKNALWVNFGLAMEDVGIFYGHLVYLLYGHLIYFMATWCILW
jgi:hypothetical protein